MSPQEFVAFLVGTWFGFFIGFLIQTHASYKLLRRVADEEIRINKAKRSKSDPADWWKQNYDN